MKKGVLLVLCAVLILFPHCTWSEEDCDREGWVVFANENYFPLLEVTIASIHAFSSRPVIAVGVNADIPFSTETYPRLIKKRIDVDLHERLIYYYKPQAILAADLDYGIYVDADAILNQGCDDLFLYCHLLDEFPLCPTHENEYAPVFQSSMDFFEVSERSMRYVHSNLVIFSKECRSFLLDWNDLCLNYTWYGMPCWDESLINILFWKRKATRQIPLCDPYDSFVDKYLSLDLSEMQQPPYNNWFLFHGNKNPQTGWEILKKLKQKHKVS